jgi:hypothetical protein
MGVPGGLLLQHQQHFTSVERRGSVQAKTHQVEQLSGHVASDEVVTLMSLSGRRSLAVFGLVLISN